jgi:hypothetical protein
MLRVLHRAVALLAAYAVALQAMLAVAVAVPHSVGADSSFAICRADDPGAPAAPAPERCEACLAGHCAGAAGKPERVTFAAPSPISRRAPVARPGAVHEARALALHAHGARAPPRG